MVIYLLLFFFPLKKEYPKIEHFTLINPLLVIDILKKFCDKKILFKFPNDIYINNKKICGILQEIILKK